MKWNEAKIINEIKELIDRNGEFPSAKYLQKNARWDLFRAIANHGGFYHFRDIFNRNITPAGYWEKNYRIEIKKIVNTLGRFPTAKEIRERSEGLFDFLFRTNLLEATRREYNYQPSIKPTRYWHNFDNLKNWLLEHFGQLIDMGVLPTAEMIAGIKGGRCIANDVMRRHGGFIKVAKLMGCKPRCNFVAPDGDYLDSNLELIVDWYLWSRNIKHKVHGLISTGKRYKYDFKLENNYYVEVWGMTGRHAYDETRKKKEILYESLGLTLISIEGALFQKSFAHIEKSLDDIFQKYFDVSKTNYQCALEDVVSKGRGYWTYENTLEELKAVIVKTNEFPSVSYLRKIGKYQIQKSIQKYGGQNKFRALLGFELNKKGKNG